METYKRLFAHIEPVTPPKGLKDSILAQIDARKRHSARIGLLWTSIFGSLYTLAIVPAVQYLFVQFNQSGFYQYVSLVFSGDPAILTYWKELGLSLVESIPVLESAVVLALVLVILGSLRFIVQDSKILFNRTQLA